MQERIHINGMLGLGDNIHQRAIVRNYLRNGYEVSISTPWPQIYWDFPIEVQVKNTTLRAQNKNANRFSASNNPVKNINSKQIWYTRENVIKYKSILGAMARSTDKKDLDFSFRPKPEWIESAKKILSNYKIEKPICFYRPLVERSEWAGCPSRNPDANSYHELFSSIKEKYFVISIGDFEPKVEWISSIPVQADLEFHKGQLGFEELCGLMSVSSLVYTSPGFALVMSQSLGVDNICVYGGRDNSSHYTPGTFISNSLSIDTESPCDCFSHTHNCNKNIDVESAKEKIMDFIK